jgi:ParB family chromosome partitioning protein
MSSRIDKMLAKSAGIRGVKDIPESEVTVQAKPKTAVGTMAAWQAAQQRIAELEASGSTVPVAIDAISANPWQPRKVFPEAEIQALADSIAELGLIQPIVVRKSVLIPDTFQIVSGERRFRAHRLLGKEDIKAIVIEVSDADMAIMAMAENIAREDLTAYEISQSIVSVQDQFKTTKRLAESIGINRTDLYKYLSFADLPDFVRIDLDVTPGLLGRDASAGIMSEIKKHGDAAINALANLWPRVKSGDLDQGKIAATMEAAVTRKEAVKTDRDIKKLFIGKEQAGSITRDGSGFTLKIKAAALTPEKETELRSFVERMFGGPA